MSSDARSPRPNWPDTVAVPLSATENPGCMNRFAAGVLGPAGSGEFEASEADVLFSDGLPCTPLQPDTVTRQRCGGSAGWVAAASVPLDQLWAPVPPFLRAGQHDIPFVPPAIVPGSTVQGSRAGAGGNVEEEGGGQPSGSFNVRKWRWVFEVTNRCGSYLKRRSQRRLLKRRREGRSREAVRRRWWWRAGRPPNALSAAASTSRKRMVHRDVERTIAGSPVRARPEHAALPAYSTPLLMKRRLSRVIAPSHQPARLSLLSGPGSAASIPTRSRFGRRAGEADKVQML